MARDWRNAGGKAGFAAKIGEYGVAAVGHFRPDATPIGRRKSFRKKCLTTGGQFAII